MNNVNLNLYKYFYEVAKYENYTKAALELMVSQPSLSYSIKVLEEQLGIKLFKKEKNHVHLTNEGAKIYEKLTVIFNLFDDINPTSTELNGKITLGLRPAFAEETMPIYMRELNLIYPNLQVEYITGETEQLKKMLYNHEVDILIDEEKLDDDVTSVLAFEDPCIFITHKHNKDKYENIVIDEKFCLKNPIYIVSMNHFIKKIMEIYPDLKYIDVRSTPLMLLKLENNEDVGLAPRIILKRELQTNEFFEINSNLVLPKAKMYASYMKRLSNKKIDAIINFFKENNYYSLLDKRN